MASTSPPEDRIDTRLRAFLKERTKNGTATTADVKEAVCRCIAVDQGVPSLVGGDDRSLGFDMLGEDSLNHISKMADLVIAAAGSASEKTPEIVAETFIAIVNDRNEKAIGDATMGVKPEIRDPWLINLARRAIIATSFPHGMPLPPDVSIPGGRAEMAPAL